MEGEAELHCAMHACLVRKGWTLLLTLQHKGENFFAWQGWEEQSYMHH